MRRNPSKNFVSVFFFFPIWKKSSPKVPGSWLMAVISLGVAAAGTGR